MSDTLVLAGEVRPEVIAVFLFVLVVIVATIVAIGGLYCWAGVRVGRGAGDSRRLVALAAAAWLGMAVFTAGVLSPLLPLLLVHPILFGVGYASGRVLGRRRPASPQPPPPPPVAP